MLRRGLILGSLAVLLTFASERFAAADVMTVAWDPPTDPTVTGYVLSYGTQSGIYPNRIDVGNKTQFTLSGLGGGTTYFFVVQSYNGFGQQSTPSQEISGPAVSVTALLSNTRFPAPTGT